MVQTIKKTIGEGDAKGELYAALAYSATDKFQGMKIKSLMLNEDEKIYFRDANAYIYSDASGSLIIAGTTVSITGTVVPNYNEGFLMTGTSRMSFYDTGLYIYSSTDGQLDVIADTVLSLASTDIILTGAITVTGAPAITGNVTITGTVGITGVVTMATSNKIQFHDTGIYIQASGDGVLNIVSDTSLTISAATDHTGVFEMQTTSKLQFHDTGLYIYASADGQLDVVADTVLALASTDITLTGAIAITGALAMSDAITMATTKKVNFHDTGASIQASSQNTLALTATTAITIAATSIGLTGATDHTGVLEMQTTSKLQFHDTGMYIYASADGALGITSDTSLTVTSPAISVVGTITMATTSKLQFHDTGMYIYASADAAMAIVGDTALAITCPAVTATVTTFTVTGALTVGVNDTGHDVQFFTATSGSKVMIDENVDALLITAVNTTMTGTLTVGINDTGHDVKLYGATTGAYLLWDESEDDLILVKSGLVIGAGAIGITFNGACTTAAISMDGITLANEDHEIEMRNTVVGDKTVICAGTATNDGEIVTAVGADADIADGSLYMSAVDGAGKLYIKMNDVWTDIKT